MRKLTTTDIKRLKPRAKPYRVRCDDTLYLVETKTGRKQFVQRLFIAGRSTDLGLGTFPMVSLQDARNAAFDNRRQLAAGIDPRIARRRHTIPTFAEAVEKVIEIHRDAWRSTRNEKQWRNSVDAYCRRIASRRIDQVQAGDVLAVLSPIWSEKRATAKRLKQRMGVTFEWAIAQGHIQTNPVSIIEASLPKAQKVQPKHQPALPFAEVGGALELIESATAWWGTKGALKFVALTATRSGEVRGMRWDEIEGDTWEVPADRMKTGRPHRVPLSRQALEVIEHARAHSDGSGLVFPSVRGKVAGDSVLSKLVRELGIKGTVHGFRSSFRDWAAEKTSVPREVAELALAHVNSDRVEAAYRRTDYYDKRRDLMQQWANFVTRDAGAKVVNIR